MRTHRLFIGPMSLNVVEAAMELAGEDHSYRPAFIPSRRQVECASLGGGYVNGWDTKAFTYEVRGLQARHGIPRRPIIVRDHAGPAQGNGWDEGIESLIADMDCELEGVHIDPWKDFRRVDEAVSKTIRLIGLCSNHNSACRFEVGTEEGIRKYDCTDLDNFLRLLHRDLPSELFGRIDFCVVQSGTNVMGDENTGTFDFDRSEKMCAIVEEYGLSPKEHNSDYLTTEQILDRRRAGVQAFNIAPEFGVLETTTVLNELERLSRVEKHLEADLKILFNTCRERKKWFKWVPSECSSDPLWVEKNVRNLVRVCGHYHFAEDWFKRLRSRLAKHCDIDRIIRDKIKERLSELNAAVQISI